MTVYALVSSQASSALEPRHDGPLFVHGYPTLPIRRRGQVRFCGSSDRGYFVRGTQSGT